jgi:hypothetical protein
LRILPVPCHMRSGGQATTRAKPGLAERILYDDEADVVNVTSTVPA